MRIYISETYEDMSRKTANIISAQIIMKPECVLGLATGASPIGAYRQLISWYRKGDLDFSGVTSINLDEYVGLGPEDSQSYAWFMRENLFRHVNIRPENTNIPNGLDADANRECARYNRIIASCHGLDLQLLGIGENGHIGFNEPGAAFEKETHRVALTQGTIQANARFFEKIEDVPRYAYSMGIKSIMQARHILLIASGEKKADAIYKALYGPVTPLVPASILQLHNNVTVVLDRAAAQRLPEGGETR